MDSSYHIRTNVSVRRELFKALEYILHIRERCYFSLVCIFKKFIKNLNPKVDVQKGTLKSREMFDNRCVSFIQFTFSFIIVMWSSMCTMLILVRVCIWVLGFYKLKSLGALMSSLEFCSWIVAKWLCSSFCLFDELDELHAMDEKIFNDFLIGKWQWLLDVIKAHLIHDLYFLYVVRHLSQ